MPADHRLDNANSSCCVTVDIQFSPWEAHISRALLESEGIPAFLVGEHLVGIQWPMALAWGCVRVVVPQSTHHAARALLAERDQGLLQAALESNEPPEPLVCAQCGGTQFRRRSHWAAALASLAMLVLWSTPFPPGKLRQCKTCGETSPW